MEVDKTQFWNDIVRMKEHRNLSWYQVSQISGASQASISRIRKGLQQPSLEYLIQIADSCGMNVKVSYRKVTETKS